MKHITFLGPVGATFSHDAYDKLADLYGAPKVVANGPEANCAPASANGEILKLIAQHGGYGAIAMETMAEGRVGEPLESFIELLGLYNGSGCPFHVAGAIRLKIHFCLMTKNGVTMSSVHKIIAHPKALGACKARVESTRLPTIAVSSNGEAARLVAESGDYGNCAALGPLSAANKYGLNVLAEGYEDREAITTFFLITPLQHAVSVGEDNRILIVFKAAHVPGSLVKALAPFADEGLNLIQIHSVHIGNGEYNFAIELEAGIDSLGALKRARREFESRVEKHISFGPFEVLSR